MTEKKFDRHGNEYKAFTFEDKAHYDLLYFEVYPDTEIEVKAITDDNIRFRALCVDGRTYLMHQIRFEIGRPHLLLGVEALAKKLRALWQ